MLSINWELAVLTFIIVPLMIYLSLYFSRKMSRAFKRMFADIADYNARVENNVSGIRVVQAFANEKHEIRRFAENNARFRLTKLITYKIMAWNSSISFILMKLISLFVLVCGTWYVINDQMTYGNSLPSLCCLTYFSVRSNRSMPSSKCIRRGSPASSGISSY